MTDWLNRTHVGDCRALMRQMIAESVQVQCIVTSPPYWGLRDYGVKGQLGLERTWQRHVARVRTVFRLARQVLAPDGVLWLNYGDSYYSPRLGGSIGKNSTINGQESQRAFRDAQRTKSKRQLSNRGSTIAGAANRNVNGVGPGIKSKDLVGMPWRVAFALQADDWWLRSDIIWHKPNPMPESVTDRPTKTHEYLFLLSRSERYYYNLEAIAEPVSLDTHARAARGRSNDHKWADSTQTIAHVPPSRGRVPGVNPKAQGKPVAGWDRGPGDHTARGFAQARQQATKFPRSKQNASFSASVINEVTVRNARTVWTIPTQGYEGAHFATFPEELVRRCVLAGSRPGDTIFDPFMGSGTVAKVATDLGRNYIGCELNPEYVELQDDRRTTIGMPL